MGASEPVVGDGAQGHRHLKTSHRNALAHRNLGDRNFAPVLDGPDEGAGADLAGIGTPVATPKPNLWI